MISKEQARYSLNNLYESKTRSFLTIISIFLGIATIFIFVSFGYGLYNYVEGISSELGIDKLIVQSRGVGAPGTDSEIVLTDTDLTTVEKTKGVTEAAGVYFRTAEVENDRKKTFPFLVGMQMDTRSFELTLEMFAIDFLKGEMLRDGQNNKIMLGYNYLIPKRIYDKPLDLNDKLTINGKDFQIIGFFDELGNPQDDSNIYMTEDAFQDLFDEAYFGMIVARVGDVDEIDLIQDRMVRKLRQSRDVEEGKEDFFVQTFDELIAAFQASLNFVVGFVMLIALVSVIVSAINTSNTMFTSILERTKEIGVIKSLGATNAAIANIFFFESVVLGFVGGTLGVLFGAIFAYLGGAFLDSVGYSFLQPYFSWWLFVACILFATFVGGVSGIVPAVQAAKKKPVDALRYE